MSDLIIYETTIVIERGARAYWLASIQKPQSQLILSIVGFNDHCGHSYLTSPDLPAIA
ncbi:hypothetical protein [Methylosarcina fibrata]|jgi:hypothetical protein|uniref:hypothetical protein n=1 Tax=Methylosarcina fibrata TaxID=105972 RepID=UPI0018DEEC8C|nr:hypothetical protein [Methylosarcina fibrata]